MREKKTGIPVPGYRGEKWIRPGLPKTGRPWVPADLGPLSGSHHGTTTGSPAYPHPPAPASWRWPKRTVYFLADPHADAEAFVASLVASGGVKKTGPENHDFRLTGAGKRAHFIIGGDCLEKGPANLALLRVVRAVMERDTRTTLLAGNHDLRVMLGLRVLGMKRDRRTEHFFLRMGPKVVPLLKEVHDHYLKQAPHNLRGIPGERKCRRKLYPSKRWFQEFPAIAGSVMSGEAVEREVGRMRKKLDLFDERCADAELSMRMAYASALKCRELFLEPGGEFAWFYERMKLARREGSFLFVHAGLDDRIAAVLAQRGTRYLNKLFRHQVHKDPFEFYYGPVANTLRTKYRKVDMPLTGHGVEKMHRLGIHAIVHGHRNLTGGQRIVSRHGMLHIESDVTMDRNSRRKEGLDGYGAGVTIIRPEGTVLGISTDFPYVKVFRPDGLETPKGKRPG